VKKTKKVAAKAGKSVNQQTVEVTAEVVVESKDKTVFTAADKADLEKQEGVIASNVGAFLVLGEALSVIKDRELHKITEPTLNFDAYCAKKWGFGEKYAYRLISSYKCVQHLKTQLAPNGVTLFPTNEAQVRNMASLSPEDQVKIWSAVLKKANGGGITAATVDEVVAGKAEKSTKPNATFLTESEKADKTAKAEHKKLKTIAKLVEKARKVDPAELNLKKLLDILDKIEELLNDES